MSELNFSSSFAASAVKIAASAVEPTVSAVEEVASIDQFVEALEQTLSPYLTPENINGAWRKQHLWELTTYECFIAMIVQIMDTVVALKARKLAIHRKIIEGMFSSLETKDGEEFTILTLISQVVDVFGQFADDDFAGATTNSIYVFPKKFDICYYLTEREQLQTFDGDDKVKFITLFKLARTNVGRFIQMANTGRKSVNGENADPYEIPNLNVVDKLVYVVKNENMKETRRSKRWAEFMTLWIPLAHQFETFSPKLEEISSLFSEAKSAAIEEKAAKDRAREERLLKQANAPTGFEVAGVRRTRTNPDGAPITKPATKPAAKPAAKPKPAVQPAAKPATQSATQVVLVDSDFPPIASVRAWNGKINPVSGNIIVAPPADAPFSETDDFVEKVASGEKVASVEKVVSVEPNESFANVPSAEPKTRAERRQERYIKFVVEPAQRTTQAQETGVKPRAERRRERYETYQKHAQSNQSVKQVVVIAPPNPFGLLECDSE